MQHTYDLRSDYCLVPVGTYIWVDKTFVGESSF